MEEPVFAISIHCSTSLLEKLHLSEVEHVRPLLKSPQHSVALCYQMTISASFATFEPCESHTMHEEAQGGSCQVVGLSHRHG